MTRFAHVSPESFPAGAIRTRLFLCCCLALATEAALFLVFGDILADLKQEFVVTNTQIGILMGWAPIIYLVAIFVVGPMCDTSGYRRLIGIAFCSHLSGILVMVTSASFQQLFAGLALFYIGLAGVDGGCNPLLPLLYPDNKPRKLNHFQVSYPATWFSD